MYFFTDPAKLIVQTDPQAYGPVKDAEATKYRVTSKFRVSGDAPAIAALGGIVLVQPHADNPELCNLAIKVNDLADDRTQFDKIDYLIYRGIRRSSFLTAGPAPTLIPEAPDNSGLVASIWASYAKAKQEQPLLGLLIPYPPPTADALGFNQPDGAQTLEATFANSSRLGQLPVVKAELSLGMFAPDVDAGIELVVFDRFYRPTVGDLRKAEMVFEVASPATAVAGHDADYATQRTRENILNYLDPAAYYTMHYRRGVSYLDSSGTEHLCDNVEMRWSAKSGQFRVVSFLTS